jgi:cytochrome b involved in lipid metabolism
MKKIIFIILTLFIILIGATFLYFKNLSPKYKSEEFFNYQGGSQNIVQNESQDINKGENQNNNNNLTTSSEKTLQNQPVKKTYSFEEVQAHNSKQSCWSAIRGKVYDLTSWISNHPGGEKAILSICGKDGTEAFVNQHGGKDKPEKALSQFEIGELQN